MKRVPVAIPAITTPSSFPLSRGECKIQSKFHLCLSPSLSLSCPPPSIPLDRGLDVAFEFLRDGITSSFKLLLLLEAASCRRWFRRFYGRSFLLPSLLRGNWGMNLYVKAIVHLSFEYYQSYGIERRRK